MTASPGRLSKVEGNSAEICQNDLSWQDGRRFDLLRVTGKGCIPDSRADNCPPY